ncbi:hypothetical protein Fisuc_0815 [Fibrobacter succinogenes subsp. succinogenes S85]|uniref:Phosphoribosyl transferase domain protein n=2 Tax=Fibrobacter succinogenes TaxID=833 RepID=A0ABM5LFU8_FIBSS|nr:hypothetical protein Fisuc_0815 [Fibrobacter succinogenes subsp. succinogenes S85]
MHMAWEKLSGTSVGLEDTDEIWRYEIYCPEERDDYFSDLHNLKKSTDKKEKYEWRYKTEAIAKCSGFLKEFRFQAENPFIIPMPPSKKKGTPEYDNRLVQIIKKVTNVTCLDIFDVKESVESTHKPEQTKDLIAIQNNLVMSTTEKIEILDLVYVLDDVLTTGTHFKAIKNKILEINPDIRVIGLFFYKPEGPLDYYKYLRENNKNG